MKSFFKVLGLAILLAGVGTNAHADELCADGRILPNCDVDKEREKKCAPDYTVYSVPFSPKVRLGGGFGRVSTAGGDQKSGTGDLSVIFLVDTTRLAVEGGAEAGSALSSTDGYAGGKISLSMRKNLKKDECSKWWAGADLLDVSGRYSSIPGVDSYLSAKLPAYIGYFTKVGEKCTLQLYGRAGVAWFDDRTAGDHQWVKPMTGAKGAVRCKSGIDVYTTSASITYDRLFNIGEEDTHVAELDLSHMFTLDTKTLGPIQLGLFAAGQYSIEGDALDAESRKIARIVGGVQLMRTSKK